MHLNEPIEIILSQMDLWYRSILGSYLLEAERAELDKCLSNLFGQHLLQIGGPSEFFLFEKSPIRHRIRLSPEAASVFRGPSVQGEIEQLPFLPETIDLALLPHVLELTSDPEFILKQLYISLAPEGHLVILGFNPISLWGLAKWINRSKVSPWRGHFRRMFTVRHWLKRQRFLIEEERTFFFRPPLTNQSWLRNFFVLEALGRLFWSNSGGIYLIVAKKQVIPLIPVENALFPKHASVRYSSGIQ